MKDINDIYMDDPLVDVICQLVGDQSSIPVGRLDSKATKQRIEHVTWYYDELSDEAIKFIINKVV